MSPALDPLHLKEFMRRAQAAQRAVDDLSASLSSSQARRAAQPTPLTACYWWHVRLRVIEREAVHIEQVSAPDSRSACKVATAAAADKWRGCTFYVIDLLQEGV